MSNVTRPELTQENLRLALSRVENLIDRRLVEKGRGAYSGPHETYGILAEEFNWELMKAMHENDARAFYKELADIAVAAIIGMASELPADTAGHSEESVPMEASGGHFKVVCKDCGTIITQCRCPSLEKPTSYATCVKCASKWKSRHGEETP